MEISHAVRLSLLNILKESTTDVDAFSRPFEINFLKNKDTFDNIKSLIETRINSALAILENGDDPFDALRELKVSPVRSVLVPKKTLFDFRQCAYIEPLDEIIYLSLAIAISNKIEKARIHKKTGAVYSYRLRPDLASEKDPTHIFDTKINYTKFRQDTSARAKEDKVKVVVACDIANFYDRLNLHRLENTLHAIDGVDKNIVRLINELLLYWSNRDSYGLPVGSNASRILAEASLINVDKYLLERKISFCRYVDDYRLFARSASEAHSWLSILVERLSHEGLFLNTSKTSIIEAKKVIHENFIVPNTSDIEAAADQEMAKTELPIIIRGYSGLIPTKFRNISRNECERLKLENHQEMRSTALESELIDPKKFTKYVRIVVAKEIWGELSNISTVLTRFPQFVPYYLDCTQKHSKELEEHKHIIIKNIEDLIKNPSILEYLRIYIIRFLAHDEFLNKSLIMECYSNLKRSEGVYLGRAILESIENIVSREDVLQIKRDFTRADRAERRQILKILRLHLNASEFNTFYKNISLNESDVWYPMIQKSERVISAVGTKRESV